jgi:hypothetical protein
MAAFYQYSHVKKNFGLISLTTLSLFFELSHHFCY